MKKEEIKIGSYVYYVSLGICQVLEIVNMGFNNEQKEYLILQAINPKNAIKVFIPIDNPLQMNNILNPLNKEEILTSIKTKPKEISWNTNKRERQELFMSCLKSHNILDIINLIFCLNKKSSELRLEKKHLSTTDNEILLKAKHIINEAVSFAYNYNYDQAHAFIISHMTFE